MILIIGGAGQGKLDYVLQKTGNGPAQVARTPEEARTIRAELDRGGTAALEARGLRCWALGNGYLVVET